MNKAELVASVQKSLGADTSKRPQILYGYYTSSDASAKLVAPPGSMK